MKANEIRLGNIVRLNNPKYHPENTGKNYIIDSIKSDDVSLIDYENMPCIILYQYLKYIEPIPLTEEWLLRFDFIFIEKSKYGNKYRFPMADWGFTIENSFTEGKWFFGHEYYDALEESLNYQSLHFAHNVKYVHELQNIMFALTGEELKIQ
jgi:hypothetical protein